jgi:hypothetical protein
MARIPTLQENDPATSPEAKEFLLSTEILMGELFNAIRLLANHPRQGRALMALIGSVRTQNSLTPAETEFAWTTSAVINGCHY